MNAKATQADYEAARAAFEAAVIGNGFRTHSNREAGHVTPRQQVAPRPAEGASSAGREATPERHMCPVGFCHPQTAQVFEVEGADKLCKRHWLKVSEPMKRAIAIARWDGGEAVEEALRNAVQEVRRNTDWARFAIGVEGRPLERFEKWEGAVLRYHSLVDDGDTPVLISGITGAHVTREQIRSQSPHRVVAVNGARLAECRTLAEAIETAQQRRAGGMWPGGEPPLVVGSWSCEDLTWEEACALARGSR